MAGGRTEVHPLEVRKRVLLLITEAMDLLDAHSMAPEAAAHLAIAQQQLRQLAQS